MLVFARFPLPLKFHCHLNPADVELNTEKHIPFERCVLFLDRVSFLLGAPRREIVVFNRVKAALQLTCIGFQRFSHFDYRLKLN